MGISADIFPRHSRILRNVFKTSNLRALPAIQTPFFHTSAIPALPLDASKVPDSPTIVGSQWTHLIRFVAGEDDTIHLGQIDPSVNKDVGLDVYNRKSVIAQLVKGSVFDGIVTDKTRTVKQLLSPLATPQIPLIRCLGLNYRDHAIEAKMPIPTSPVLFIKPRTSLSGPGAIPIPKIAQDASSDYEAELTFVIAKDGRDIPEDRAMEHVLGVTCGNDVSARKWQFANSQWNFSKGFDGAAPIGPVLVRPGAIGDLHGLRIKAVYQGEVVQDSNTREMIFNIPQIIAFLSQGTTLERGTVVMTGTGPGPGWMREPKIVLRHGVDIRVWIEGVGTLINRVHYE